MATVTTRPSARWLAALPPARSICDSSQPPKMSPLAFVSAGMAKVRSAGSIAGGLSDSAIVSPYLVGAVRFKYCRRGDFSGGVGVARSKANDLFGSAKKDDSYTAKDIEVLEGLEPVRRRPGMYVGGTDERALHHLVAEILDNAMDEAVAGHASLIEVTLEPGDFVTIHDNGRGMPVDPHPKFKNKSALEVILTTLHSGGKFSDKAYKTSGGLH